MPSRSYFPGGTSTMCWAKRELTSGWLTVASTQWLCHKTENGPWYGTGGVSGLWNPLYSHTHLIGLCHSASSRDQIRNISRTTILWLDPPAFPEISPSHLSTSGAPISIGLSVLQHCSAVSTAPPRPWVLTLFCHLAHSVLRLFAFYWPERSQRVLPSCKEAGKCVLVVWPEALEVGRKGAFTCLTYGERRPPNTSEI